MTFDSERRVVRWYRIDYAIERSRRRMLGVGNHHAEYCQARGACAQYDPGGIYRQGLKIDQCCKQ